MLTLKAGSMVEMHGVRYEVIELLCYGPGEKNIYLRLKECKNGNVYRWAVSMACVRSVEK